MIERGHCSLSVAYGRSSVDSRSDVVGDRQIVVARNRRHGRADVRKVAPGHRIFALANRCKGTGRRRGRADSLHPRTPAGLPTSADLLLPPVGVEEGERAAIAWERPSCRRRRSRSRRPATERRAARSPCEFNGLDDFGNIQRTRPRFPHAVGVEPECPVNRAEVH